MNRYLLAYRCEGDILEFIKDILNYETEWEINGNKEILFSSDQNTSIFQNKIISKLDDMLFKKSNLGSVVRTIDLDKYNNNPHLASQNLVERVTIHDIMNVNVVPDVIHKESFGGDIRKYLRSVDQYSYRVPFKLFGTRDPVTTALEPMSISSVRKLSESEYADYKMHKNTELRKPTAGRILEWSRRVQNKWDLKCGAIGAIRYSKDNLVDVGLDGFIIYDVDEEVIEWCKKRWNPNNWFGVESGQEKVKFPYMYPDEYDVMYDTQDKTPRTAIRMWWD